MPLSAPGPREPIHQRKIHCEGFRRPDGLVEIDGHITDTRPFPYYGHWEGEIVDGAPVHEMWLRLVIDQNRQIVDVEAAMDHTPFPRCLDVNAHYRRLIGLQIGAGLNKQVFERVGGTQGCTHVTGMIQIMATTLFQALASEAQRIRLAHLFDPVLAVHTSLVEPLPHQITAVYESMLPRQPLRFLLADDPGAGKTITAYPACRGTRRLG